MKDAQLINVSNDLYIVIQGGHKTMFATSNDATVHALITSLKKVSSIYMLFTIIVRLSYFSRFRPSQPSARLVSLMTGQLLTAKGQTELNSWQLDLAQLVPPVYQDHFWL